MNRLKKSEGLHGSSLLFDRFHGFRRSTKRGYIDKTGKLVIARQYDVAETFYEGLAAVMVGEISVYDDSSGKWGYIDTSGKYVWEPTN